MQAVMIDLETYGTKPGCVILSIGAVAFDPKTGETGESLYFNLDRAEQMVEGLEADPDTVAWWGKQSEQARAALEGDQVPFREAHAALRKLKPRNAGIWCQGATFDAPIWDAGVAAFNLPPAWRFYDVRDTRTVYDLANFDPARLKRNGTYHHALDDALFQVRCVAAAWAAIEAGVMV